MPQVAPDPNPPVVKAATSATTYTHGWSDAFDKTDAMSVWTKETRFARRCCSPGLTVLLVVEVGIILTSVIVLATWGSGAGITIRTDIGALICSSVILLGMLGLALIEIVTSGCGQSSQVLLVYLQIAIHINAVGLGSLTLLGHATWLLAQILLVAAAFAWVVGLCGLLANLWYWFYFRKAVPAPRLRNLQSRMLGIYWKTSLLVWALLVSLAVVALVFPKLPDTVGLSVQLSMAEHVLLLGLGGVFCSALLAPLLLALSRRARYVMVRAVRWRNPCLRSLTILSISVVLHLLAALAIPLLAHVVLFGVGLFLVWLLVCLTRCSRRAVRPRRVKSVVPVALFAPVLGLFKVMGFLALFLFDCAFLERFMWPRQAFVLVQRDGSCGQRSELLTDGALDAWDCAAYAEDAAAVAFSFSHSGECYSYIMRVTDEDWSAFRDLGVESTCTEGFFLWDELPNQDFYVMHPRKPSCSFGQPGGPLHRDQRRLVVVSGSGRSLMGGTALMPAAIEQLWTWLGMAPIGHGLRRVSELYLKLVRSVLALEPYIPKVIPLQCAALRRLASASQLLAGLLLFAGLGNSELLNVMAASQDMTAARAASSGSRVAYLGLMALGQALQQLVLILFQVAIAASVHMRYEALGVFDRKCGLLVGEDLDGTSCPNFWHVPVDVLAIVVLIFGFALCFVVILLLPFRRFMAISAPARWLTTGLFRGLRRPELFPAPLSEKLQLVVWPLTPLLTTCGVWTEAGVQVEQCKARMETLEPAPLQVEQTSEGEEAPGAAYDVVSLRSMAEASARLCAMAWLLVPLLGPMMCKATLYLNRHKVFTCGHADAQEEAVSFDFDLKRRDETHLQHMLQEMPLRFQVTNWCCSVLMLLFLLLIQSGPGYSLQQKLEVLAIFMAVVTVLALIWCITDLWQMLRRCQAMQELIESCEDLMANTPFTPSEEDPLKGLSPADRFRVKRCWRELQQLAWVAEGRLPSTVYAWLCSKGFQCNAGQLLLGLLQHRRRQEHAKDQAEASGAVLLAAQVLLLRVAAQNDLCLLEAREAAKRKAQTEAVEAAKKRAPAFQKWCQHKASTRAAAAANAMIMASQSRLSKVREKRPLWLRFSFAASTEARVSVASRFQRRGLKPEEARHGVSVWGYVHLEWPVEKEGAFSHKDAPVTHLDLSVEQVPDPNELMSLPSLEPTPPEPVEEFDSQTLSWWEQHLGCKVSLVNPKEVVHLMEATPEFVVRKEHLQLVPALPMQQAAVVSMLPDVLKFTSKDEHLHVLWNHAVEADERITRDEANVITQLEDAIRASAWHSRTWFLAGTFFAAVSESLGARSNLPAEEAARRAVLLGICAKLMAKNGRRRDAHARELDRIDSVISDEGEVSFEPVDMKPSVSFRNFSVDLSDQPTSPTSVATQALREALARSPVDLEELSMALERARRADVDAMLLQRGEEIFMSIIDKQAAVTRLATAIQNRMLKELRAAVQKAQEVNLASTEYPDADGVGILQRARAVIEEEERVCMEELRNALSGGALRLQRALAQAEEAHLEEHAGGAQLLNQARQNLAAIARKKQCIALLKVALDSGNVGLLEAAIAECQKEGVEGEVNLDVARKRLATLRTAAQRLQAQRRPMSPAPIQELEPETPKETPEERAANMLQAALCHEPLDARLLRLALQEALAVGLSGPDVARAQELLAMAESKALALEEVRRAGVERNAQALAAAIKRCRKLGIAAHELLQALQQLTEEMAKVAKIAGDHGISNLMLEDVEQTRRELHDKVQAVRGGVRVICRIRPFVEDDDVTEEEKPMVEEVDHFTLKVATNKMNQVPLGDFSLDESFREASLATEAAAHAAPSNASNNKVTQATSNFRFNGRVLGPRSSQEQVFNEVQGMVQSAVDGYNVLIAAGGSKFSGKSYTIFGPPFQKPAPGMPKERDWSGLATRVVEEVFKIQERDDWRALLEVELQVVEVRGDRSVDLLGRTSRPEMNEHRAGHLAFAGAMLLSGAGESTYVEGASSRRIADSAEFLRVVNGALSQAEGPYMVPSPRTPASVPSARGEVHVLIVLHFTRTNRATGAAVRSKLVLADLAPMSSPAVGGTVGYSKEVAAAYHALEAIIKAARRDGQAAAVAMARRKHVLGQILRDCLCGNARPVFLMHLNPSPQEKVHTMHAVTFATALGGRAAR